MEVLAALVGAFFGGLIAGLVGWRVAKYQHGLDVKTAERNERADRYRTASDLSAQIAATSSSAAALLSKAELEQYGRPEDRRQIWGLVREDVSWLIVNCMRLAEMYQHFPDPDGGLGEDVGTPPADLMSLWMEVRWLGDLLSHTLSYDDKQVNRYSLLVEQSGLASVSFSERNWDLLAAVKPADD